MYANESNLILSNTDKCWADISNE